MTPEQYERWKDFSLRMVNVAVGPRKKSPSRAMVRENIEFFFECRMEPYEEWKRVVDWDWTEPCEEYNRSYPVTDHLKDMEEYWIPGYWAHTDDSEEKYDKLRDKWVAPASCCIRAGLDIAVSPSAGVAGFTAGDLRKMYPEGVPGWVKDFFQPGTVHDLATTSIEGIYVPVNERFDARTFDELPDDEYVWL